jgi:hypothetical protein
MRVAALTLISLLCTFSALGAGAAVRCENIFSGTPPGVDPFYQQTYDLLQKLKTVQDGLQDRLEAATTPAVLEQKAIQKELDQISLLSKQYLKKSGIQFKVVPAKYENVAVTNKTTVPLLEYDRFQILGAKNSHEMNALQLDGFVKNPRMKKTLTFLDPLHEMRTTYRIAGQFKGSVNTLAFGFGALSGPYDGSANVIRHEMQHAFEYQKKLDGRLTLASFYMDRTQSANGGTIYNNGFGMDEMEAHLRNVRLFVKIDPRSDIPSRRPAPGLTQFNRQNQLKMVADILGSMTKDATISLAALKNKIQEKDSVLGTVSVNRYQPVYWTRIEGLTGGTFDVIEVYLKTENPEEFRKILLERVEWAQTRVGEIQAELNRLVPGA